MASRAPAPMRPLMGLIIAMKARPTKGSSRPQGSGPSSLLPRAVVDNVRRAPV